MDNITPVYAIVEHLIPKSAATASIMFTALHVSLKPSWRDLLPFGHKTFRSSGHRKRSSSSQRCCIGLRSGLNNSRLRIRIIHSFIYSGTYTTRHQRFITKKRQHIHIYGISKKAFKRSR